MLKFIMAFGLIFSSAALAAGEADHVMIKPNDVKWVEGPPSLPAGVKMALLYGDPGAAGPFGMRLKFPAKYAIAPHFHPQDENVTVISGTFWMGTGDDAKASPHELPAGSFVSMKKGTHHFARAEKEVIVQINSVGPWDITYINASEDPRNKKK